MQHHLELKCGMLLLQQFLKSKEFFLTWIWFWNVWWGIVGIIHVYAFYQHYNHCQADIGSFLLLNLDHWCSLALLGMDSKLFHTFISNLYVLWCVFLNASLSKFLMFFEIKLALNIAYTIVVHDLPKKPTLLSRLCYLCKFI